VALMDWQSYQVGPLYLKKAISELFTCELSWVKPVATFTHLNIIRYSLYTIPPTALSVPVVAMWRWVGKSSDLSTKSSLDYIKILPDVSIKKLQPYIDLSNGQAPASKTLLLDYNASIPWLVWIDTLRNKHYSKDFPSVIMQTFTDEKCLT
jgi:hypothetical protein